MNLFLVLAATCLGVSAEEILGSYIFQRHGDRLQKPTLYLTPIGTREVEEAGAFFHDRYFNQEVISGMSIVYDTTQFSIATPSADVLFKSMLAFTNGFYPPLNSTMQAQVQGADLSNDTVESTALSMQYVFIDGVDEDSADHWTVQGTDDCPALTKAQKTYPNTEAFASLNASTADFYSGLWQYVQGNFDKSKLNYANAYTVFDHFLTHDVHNETFHNLIGGQDSDVYKQVQTLQDVYSKNLNVVNNNTDAMIGGYSIVGNAYKFMNQFSNTSSPQRIQVVGGSYDAFYQAFSALDLYTQDEARFTGIVNYASSLVFELYKNDDSDDQFVRVGIRNGSTVAQPDVTLDFYPVFNSSSEGMPLSEFVSNAKKVSIDSTADWCSACGSDNGACQAIKLQNLISANKIKTSDLSLAAAGGIGAGVTIGVLLILGAIAGLWLSRSRKSTKSGAAADTAMSLDHDTLNSVTQKV